MSAFLSFPYPDRIELLADGATCLPSGAFLKATDKIRVSPFVPLVVTGRGWHRDIERLAECIILLSSCGSVDETLAAVVDVLEDVRSEPGETQAFELVIAAYSETTGPRHMVFKSFAFDDMPAWTLVDYTGQVLGGGPDFDEADLLATGLAAADFADGAQGGGVALMEFMRGIPGRNERDPTGVRGYWIGGHVDHAVVGANGVVVTRVKEWPDTPFRKIDPH